MSWNENVYYSANAHGLTIIGEIQWGEPEYDFDITAIWKSDNGEYYVASDSGCSCPSPFENYDGIEDLGPVLSISEAYGVITDQFVAYMKSQYVSESNKEYVFEQFREFTKTYMNME